MSANGIFCLEGEWESDLAERKSVLPILELLERLGSLKFIHRDVASVGEVKRYLHKWNDQAYEDYEVLYLATHGERDRIVWSGDAGPDASSTLPELAELLGGAARGCYIYLGGCSTLLKDESLTDFVSQTGAAAVLGYRKNVDWLEAASFEVLLLSLMASNNRHPKALVDRLLQRSRDLAENLDFVLATSRGVWPSTW